MKSVAIIGAGPAGMKAAITLTELGLAVTVLDEQPSPGGQIYRNVEHNPEPVQQKLGPDYQMGKSLTLPFLTLWRDHKLEYIAQAVVWGIGEQKRLHWKVKGQTFTRSFDFIIVANGALERPFPVPGWTLPRVMTAGAAQILLKSGGVALEKSVIMGSGPLMYLLAAQLIKFGKKPVALIETQTLMDQIRGIRHLRPDRVTVKYLLKGLGLMLSVIRAGVPRYTGAQNIAIETDGEQLKVAFSRGRQRHQLNAGHALMHAGVIPNTQLTRALDIEHYWDEGNACFAPRVDATGKARGADHVWVTGDGAKILGADAAALSGEIAALAIAREVGIEMTPMSTLLTRKNAYISIRQFLDRVYAPPSWLLNPDDDTLVCRCEEVTAGDIRKAIAAGAQGPNQAKAFTRSGMGNCQGRYCGHTVTNIFASERKTSQNAVGYYRIRTPIKPITLSELARHEFK